MSDIAGNAENELRDLLSEIRETFEECYQFDGAKEARRLFEIWHAGMASIEIQIDKWERGETDGE